MHSVLIVVGLILVAFAAILHVYFFVLESMTWTKPKTWKTFGIPNQESADIIRPMAYNQGFYNLFLALGIGVGIALFSVNSTVAYTLIFFAALSMVGAGAVLFFSVKTSRKAAFIQTGPPLIGVLLLLIGRSI